MNRIIKRGAQAALSVITRSRLHFSRKSILILTYHRILPKHHPGLGITQPGMVVFDETFEMHLRVLTSFFNLVSLADWLERVQRGLAVPERACAITFDDGWRDTFEVAYPILQAMGVPATIFLVSDMVGMERHFWPERLAALLWNNGNGQGAETWHSAEFLWLLNLGVRFTPRRPPTREELDAIITKAKVLPDVEIEAELERMESRTEYSSAGQRSDLLNWQQINEMLGSGLIEVGSHTQHHRRLLESLDRKTMADEICGSKKEIEQHTGVTVKMFCYPDGVASPSATLLVAANYVGACSTIRGWNSTRSDRYCLKRIGLHQDIAPTETAFLARLSGWL